MELLIGIALKTISNYLEHISPAPIDEAFVGRSPMINVPARGSQNQVGERITITNWLINLLNKTRPPQGDLDNHLVRASLRHAGWRQRARDPSSDRQDPFCSAEGRPPEY
jgi:hypothetical protein